MAQPVVIMQLARSAFTFDFNADIARRVRTDSLSWTDAGKALHLLLKEVFVRPIMSACSENS